MSKMLWKAFWLLLAVGFGIALSSKPWQHYQNQRKKMNEEIATMRKDEANYAELLTQKARLESPLGREQRARELGYRKPNEVPLEVHTK